MARILSYNSSNRIGKQARKESIFKTIWDWFNSQDKFLKFSLLTILLILIATPFIVKNLLELRQRAATNALDTPLPNHVVFDYKSRIDAILPTNNYVYVGGDFTYVGPDTGPGAPVDTSTGQVSSAFPKVGADYNYQKVVRSAVSDGSGGWYIGGNFTKVDSLPIGKLAHIRSDGTVDPSFNLNVSSVNPSTVSSLKLSSDGRTLYVGGSYTSIGGQTRNRIAAINTSDDIVTPFNPDIGDGQVSTMEISSDGSTIYVAGSFSKIGGQTRVGIAAINTSDGSITSFNPGTNRGIRAIKLSPNGSLLYVVGDFREISNQPRSNIAAINTSDGSITSFSSATSFISVKAMALSNDGSTLYVSGTYADQPTSVTDRLAAINTSDGSLTSFNPNITRWYGGTYKNAKINTMELSSDNSTLYIGGYFDSIGIDSINEPRPIPRYNAAAIDTITGNPTAWDPKAGDEVNVLAFNSDRSRIYIGGSFASIGEGTYLRNSVARFNPDGTLDPTFEPYSLRPNTTIRDRLFGFRTRVQSFALSKDGNTLYIGGQASILRVNTAEGLFRQFQDSMGTGGAAWGANITSLALSNDDSILYAGGEFIGNDGTTRNHLAAIDTSTRLLTSFDPNANGNVNSIVLSSDGSKLYVGGDFTTIGGQPRNRIAAINTSDGTPTSFNPDASGNVNSISLSNDDSKLYVGGYFTSVGGQTRNRVAAINTSDGSLTSFDPNANERVNSLALSSDESTLYLAGYFTTLAGQTRQGIASVNISDGSLQSWDPQVTSELYKQKVAHSPDESRIYVGGSFIGQFLRFGNPSPGDTITPTPTLAPTPTEAPSPTSPPTQKPTVIGSSVATVSSQDIGSSLQASPLNLDFKHTVQSGTTVLIITLLITPHPDLPSSSYKVTFNGAQLPLIYDSSNGSFNPPTIVFAMDSPPVTTGDIHIEIPGRLTQTKCAAVATNIAGSDRASTFNFNNSSLYNSITETAASHSIAGDFFLSFLRVSGLVVAPNPGSGQTSIMSAPFPRPDMLLKSNMWYDVSYKRSGGLADTMSYVMYSTIGGLGPGLVTVIMPSEPSGPTPIPPTDTPTPTPVPPTDTPTPTPVPPTDTPTPMPPSDTPTPTPSPIPVYSISGSVYIDVNNNGVQDAGELNYTDTIPTIKLGITDPTTSSGGDYSFTNLAGNSSYDITLTVPVGYTLSNSGLNPNTNPRTVTVTDSDVTNVNFGIIAEPTNTPTPTETPILTPTETPIPTPTPTPVPVYSISGAVYIDVNNNGVKDGAEVNYTSTIPIIKLGVIDPTTNSGGDYSFTNLAGNSSYDITLTVPVGYTLSNGGLNPNTNPRTVTVTDSDVTNVNFGIIAQPTNTPAPTATPTPTSPPQTGMPTIIIPNAPPRTGK